MCNTSRLIWSTVCCQGVGHMERLTNCNCQPLVKLLLLLLVVQRGSCAVSEPLRHKVQERKKKPTPPADSELTLEWFTALRVTKASANNKVQQPFWKNDVCSSGIVRLAGFSICNTHLWRQRLSEGGGARLESQCTCSCVCCRLRYRPPF